MSIVWIVTTGNSDVKLKDKTGWGDLRTKKQEQLHPCENEFSPSEEINSDQFTLPPRVMGIVYGDAIGTHGQYLKFPLLDRFYEELTTTPDRIIVLLTDQEDIFDASDRNDPDCPYWKDTCTLQPIFEHFFKQRFNIDIEPMFLQPKSGSKGLDDWDATLKLVQIELDKLGITHNDEVIVSHQAGTPAISSAVQFVSLVKFQGKVSFLLSNERSQEVNLIPYSSYFQSMEIEEAKKLLGNHNYVGVESVLKDRLKADDRDVAKSILALLEVAKLWNLSKFDDDFKEKMKNLDIEDLKESATSRFNESWAWWIAYEEAYLALVRREQGNIVEAFFHSFRAFEGIFAEWGNKIFKEKITVQKDIPCLTKDVLEGDYQKYLAGSDLKCLREELSTKGILKLELMTLCKIFKKNRPDYKPKKCPDIITFWDDDREKCISARRNFVFHQVQGINEGQLLNFWQVDSTKEAKKQIKDWENKILNFLNFIADEREFKNWSEASLMARVHQELVKAIDDL